MASLDGARTFGVRARSHSIALAALMVFAAVGSASAATPEGTAFTFSRLLTGSLATFSGSCDLSLTLFDAASGGLLVAGPITRTVSATSGKITVADADFGLGPFDGNAVFIETAAKCPATAASAIQTGRTGFRAVPYAIDSLSTNALRGRAVSNAVPGTNQVLTWDGTNWAPATENLGAAYRAGRKITTDLGAVEIQGAGGLDIAGELRVAPSTLANDLRVLAVAGDVALQLTKANGTTPAAEVRLGGPTAQSVNTGNVTIFTRGAADVNQHPRFQVNAEGAVRAMPNGNGSEIEVRSGGAPTATDIDFLTSSIGGAAAASSTIRFKSVSDTDTGGAIEFYTRTGPAADVTRRLAIQPNGDLVVPTRPLSFSLDSTAFVPGDSDFAYTSAGGLRTHPGNNASEQFFADVHLPDGAVVNQLQAVTLDTNATVDVRIELVRSPLSPTSTNPLSLMASVSSSGPPGTQTKIDATIATPMIDNLNNAYLVRVTFGSGTQNIGPVNLALKSVRIHALISKL